MPERRPIASRNTKIAGRIAKGLVDRGVSPNQISIASMVFAGLAGLAFWASGWVGGVGYGLCLVIAAVACQLRLLCNLFDGMVALEGGKASADGPFWNEAPDRAADAMILVGMGLAVSNPALGWAAAAFAVGTAYIRELGTAQGLPTDFQGPMAKPQRMATATIAALIAIAIPSVAGWPTLSIALWLIVLGTCVTIIRRCRRMIVTLKSSSKN